MQLRTKCPACGYVFDDQTAIGGDGPRQPTAGSISICIACGEPGIYVDDMLGLRIRQPTDEERAELDADETVRQVRAAWREVERRHPHAWPGRRP